MHVEKNESTPRVLFLSNIPTDFGDAETRAAAMLLPGFAIEVSIHGLPHPSGNAKTVLDNIVVPLIEEALRQDVSTNWKEKIDEMAQDCIRAHEDDLVSNLMNGYVSDQPIRAAIERWVGEDTTALSLTLVQSAKLLDKLGNHLPLEYVRNDGVLARASLAWIKALQSRIDAMLEEMENQEMEDPTTDDFRNMVRRVAGYEVAPKNS